MRDAKKTPLYMIAQIKDIQERKEAEQQLRVRTEELERVRKEHDNVLNAVDDGVHWIGLDGLIKFENPSSARMLGYEVSELIGVSAHSIMHHAREDGTPYPIEECPIHATLRDGVTRHVKDEVFWRKDGTCFAVEYTSTPTFADNGDSDGSVVTFTDVTARKAVEAEMQNARVAAETANRAKTEFLASMSHEIRTPLNGIIGMTDLIIGTSLSLEQKDFIETIHASGENLLAIVNDVLDFSKIEFGKLELDHHAFSLLDMIDDVVGLLIFRMTQKKIEFLTSIDHHLPVDYLGDATRVRQILVNLVNNAIKFTETGEIRLEVSAGLPRPTDRPNTQRLIFRVKDTGIGIPPDRLDRLFKVFSQVDASTTRRYGGSGLGLAICQKLVDVMGGTIGVESEPGQGSNFHFEIPLQLGHSAIVLSDLDLEGHRVLIVDDIEMNRRMLALQLERWGIAWADVATGHEAVDLLRKGERFDIGLIDFQMPHTDGIMVAREIRRVAPELPLVLVSSQTGDISMEELTRAGYCAVLAKPVRQNLLRSTLQQVFRDPNVQIAPTVVKSVTRVPLSILVVEDNPTNQKVATQIVKRLGYTVDIANNGKAGVSAAERKHYDLILMDVHMPEMDGLQATRLIRSSKLITRRPMIVALTADVLVGEREVCIEAGMDDYLTKPVKIEVLKNVLESLKPQPSPSA
jgi:two-component system sensor histidine kinase/response regulator